MKLVKLRKGAIVGIYDRGEGQRERRGTKERNMRYREGWELILKEREKEGE